LDKYRATITDVIINEYGQACGVLLTEDNFKGQLGRNPLEKGREVTTSVVLEILVTDKGLTLKTLNSLYLVEGEITTYMGLVFNINQSLSKETNNE